MAPTGIGRAAAALEATRGHLAVREAPDTVGDQAFRAHAGASIA
jgi:hypothetical protein